MGEERVGSTPTLKELFDDSFPAYLAIGMTYNQFWNEDVYLVKHYRKAHEIKYRMKNQELWLQGLYFTNALNATVGNLFSKKGASTIEYMAQPIPITQKEQEERKKQKMLEQAEGFRTFIEAKQVEKELKEAGNGYHN